MNKAQKQVQQAHLDEEKKVIKLLQIVYNQAKKDCEQKIRELSGRTDLENLQSIVYQKQYQEALKKQLEGVLDNLQGKQFTSIADYLQNCYTNGFVGNMYDLHNQGIPLIIPIRQDEVVKAVQTDTKLSQGLYKRLGEDVSYLKRSVRAELSRGISTGSSWNEIAVHIAKGMNSPFDKAYNNAIRIARTEGHRIQNEAALNGQNEAKKKGADIVKQWDATLDGRTRPEHREADGQLRELDEPFDVGGEKMEAPGVGGSARNVCNCRCCLLQRAKWALDEDELKALQERAAYFGLDKTKDFDDFKQKYLQLPDNTDTIDITKRTVADCKDFYELGKYMNDHYGVSVDSSVGKLDFDAVHQGVQGIEQVMNEFPQAKSTLKSISTDKTGVMAAGYDGTITFNPSYYTDVSKLSSMIQGNTTGFHPKNNDLLTTGSHEMGHLLERTLIEKSMRSGKYTFGVIEWNKCGEAKRVVSEASKNAKKSPEGKNPSTGKAYRNFELTAQVSGYAMQNSSECLAECVADYVANGENASILSKEVWKILKRELG